MPPVGSFYTELNPSHTKHYLAFAAGSGVTPVLSLIKTTLAVEPKSQFHAGVRQPESQFHYFL